MLDKEMQKKARAHERVIGFELTHQWRNLLEQWLQERQELSFVKIIAVNKCAHSVNSSQLQADI
jgi:hypothetical protein